MLFYVQIWLYPYFSGKKKKLDYSSIISGNILIRDSLLLLATTASFCNNFFSCCFYAFINGITCEIVLITDRLTFIFLQFFLNPLLNFFKSTITTFYIFFTHGIPQRLQCRYMIPDHFKDT